MSRVNRVVPALFLSVNRLKTLCYGYLKAVPMGEIGEIPNGYYPSIVKDNSALLRSPGWVNARALLQRAGIHIVRTMVCCGALHRKRGIPLSLPSAAIPIMLRPDIRFRCVWPKP